MIIKNKTSVQKQLQLLQEEYDAILPERLEKMANCISEIKKDPVNQRQIISLYKLVHGLVGSGTTFGYKEISNTSQDLELLVKKWLEKPLILEVTEIGKAERIIEQLIYIYKKEKTTE